MKFATTKTLKTSVNAERLLDVIQESFSGISASVQRGANYVEAKDIEATFGSINRTDVTRIKIKEKSNGWLITAETEYKPTQYFWLFAVLGVLFWLLGAAVPVGFYLYHKTLVKKAVENALQKVNDELEDESGNNQNSRQTSSRMSDGVTGEIEQLAELHKKGILSANEFESAKRKLLGTASEPSTNHLFMDDSEDIVFVRRDGKVASKQFRKAELQRSLSQLRDTDEFATAPAGPWRTKADFFG